MMKKLIITILFITFIFMGCGNVFAAKLSKSEFRQVQTKIYDTSDRQKVMIAAVATLQDSDYIIEEFEPDLGFIRAKKIFKKLYINKGRLAGQSALLAMATSYAVFTWGSTAAYTYTPARKITDELHSKTAVVDINVDVDNYGLTKTKVRMIANQKVLQNAEGFSYTKAAPIRAYLVSSKKVYEEFFNQLGIKLGGGV